jgi:hypothetical protein
MEPGCRSASWRPLRVARRLPRPLRSELVDPPPIPGVCAGTFVGDRRVSNGIRAHLASLRHTGDGAVDQLGPIHHLFTCDGAEERADDVLRKGPKTSRTKARPRRLSRKPIVTSGAIGRLGSHGGIFSVSVPSIELTEGRRDLCTGGNGHHGRPSRREEGRCRWARRVRR